MLVAKVAELVGVDEGPVALLVALLICYPLAMGWRILPDNPILKHFYSYISGLFVMWTAYGPDALLHGTITILTTWTLLKVLPPKFSLPAGWIFNVSYLMGGYYYYLSPDGYTLNWTTPQCILTLRLVGMCFDVADGQLKPEDMDKDAKARHLKKVPGLLETLSFNYHFGGALVGPQFPYRMYEQFVHGQLLPSPRPSSGFATLQCFIGGVFYIAMSQVANAFYSPEIILTEKYLYSRPLVWRFIDIVLCARGFMYKYLGVWKFGEAPNILTGLSYNGVNKDGTPKWDGVTNIYLVGFEFATRLQSIIENFNTNTNMWMKVYVMKRLRFLGSKNASQLGALMFLALWHGPYLGYFFSFGMEFVDMMIERELSALTSPWTQHLFLETATPSQKILGKFYCCLAWLGTLVTLALGTIPFIQLTLHRSTIVFSSIHWVALWVYPMFFLYLVLKPTKRKKQA